MRSPCISDRLWTIYRTFLFSGQLFGSLGQMGFASVAQPSRAAGSLPVFRHASQRWKKDSCQFIFFEPSTRVADDTAAVIANKLEVVVVAAHKEDVILTAVALVACVE